MVDPAAGGLERSVTSLSKATDKAAIPAAMLAETAHTGGTRRRVASPSAPIDAMSGHFTHQADAAMNKIVSGSQRMP
jgi:hypothetical protein